MKFDGSGAGSFMSFAEYGLNISSSVLLYEHDQIKNLHL